ncbi:MAG: hypothetical protein H0T62_09305 [Parachlamydiaceae bacterium]|nr:hypothetical protein [Parachlamydiaceae bacterium]
MLSRSMFGSLFISLISAGCQQQSIIQEECLDRSYVHPYGLEVEADHWVQCGRNGQVVSFLQDGSRITQNYADGMLEGESSYTFPYSSQIQCVENYWHDKLLSQTTYDASGMPQHAIVNSDDEIRTITTWYPSGSPKSVEKYDRHLLVTGDYYTPNNQRDSWVYDGQGERITRDYVGNCISLDTYKCGELVLKTLFYPNGHPMEIAPYMDGMLHGERKTYYDNGEPKAFESWSLGQQNGTTVIFQNGEKYSELPYLAGKKNGLETRYRDGSVVTQEITWLDDQMHGPTFTHTGNNETMLCDWFYKGRLTSQSNYESFNLPKPKN